MAYCTCKYCGQSFSLMITSDDLKKQYTAAVSDLPASSLDSEGYLLWKPKFQYLRVAVDNTYLYYGNTSEKSTCIDYSMRVSIGEPSIIFLIRDSSSTFNGNFVFQVFCTDKTPVDGYYATYYHLPYNAYRGDSSSPSASSKGSFSNFSFFEAGSTVSFPSWDNVYCFYSDTFRFVFSPLVVRIKPTNGLVDPSKDSTYGSSTRPGSLIGDFNIVNNNTTTKVENTTIVNETNNTYYNPVTNETHNYNNWTYDYSSRTYEFNTGNTITYGDEYVTIKEGDTIYNIYYYVNPTTPDPEPKPEPEPEPGACQHSYTAEETNPATCTDPGVRTYTCSQCGNQYVEQIAALGHDWLASEVVADTYSLPEGTSCPDCGGTNFTQELDKNTGIYSLTCSDCQTTWTAEANVTYGHTRYTCSRCGESYEDSNNPDRGLFAAIGSFIAGGINWAVDKLKQLIDSLSGINEIFSGFVDKVKEKSGAYPAFLGAVLALLPDDLMTVFWFGIVAAIVLVVWKHWFR